MALFVLDDVVLVAPVADELEVDVVEDDSAEQDAVVARDDELG